MYRRQGSKPSLGKEMQNSKMAVWGSLTNSCEKKRSEKQRRPLQASKTVDLRGDSLWVSRVWWGRGVSPPSSAKRTVEGDEEATKELSPVASQRR